MAESEETRNERTGNEKQITCMKAVIFFCVLVAAGLGAYSFITQTVTHNNVQSSLREKVTQQNHYVQEILSERIKLISDASEYFAGLEDPFAEDNMQMLQFLKNSTGAAEMMLMDSEGNGYCSDDTVQSVADQGYYQKGMLGKQVLFESVYTKASEAKKVALCIPVQKDEKIIGVVGGIYNVDDMSQTLFGNVTDEQGYYLIVSTAGEISFYGGSEENRKIKLQDRLFAYYTRLKMNNDELEQMKNDFKNQAAGSLQQGHMKNANYLVYEPTGINSWMLFYVVSKNDACQPYDYIMLSGLLFACIVLVGGIMLLRMIWKNNTRSQIGLIKDAQTDALTGLLNKRSTREKVDEWLAGEGRFQSHAFLMVDVDKFKDINDIFGHAAGDEVLREIGKLLKLYFRDGDVVGRIGGDEFVILMKGISSKEDVLQRAEGLCRGMNSLQVDALGDHPVTISMGIAMSPKDGNNFMELYVSADEALYHVKRNGRNGCWMQEGSPQQ